VVVNYAGSEAAAGAVAASIKARPYPGCLRSIVYPYALAVAAQVEIESQA